MNESNIRQPTLILRYIPCYYAAERLRLVISKRQSKSKTYWARLYVTEPFVLGEFGDNMVSVGWRKNYPWTWYTSYFFQNKTFLFVKIERWNFQHLFDETLQNFTSFIQTFRRYFCMEGKIVWMSWNFVRFHEIINHRDAKNFRFLSWQTKFFYS